MQKVRIELEDDLTGGPADETVQFGVDGVAYELDLSAKHAADLRHRLARFVEHARIHRPVRSRASARTTASRERSRQIRVWAQEEGFDVAGHGRLPAEVVRQYESAPGRAHPSDRTPHRPDTSRASRPGQVADQAARSPLPKERKRSTGRNWAAPGDAAVAAAIVYGRDDIAPMRVNGRSPAR
jgi:hypothetical protein